jgi:type II secretory pathway component PulM
MSSRVERAEQYLTEVDRLKAEVEQLQRELATLRQQLEAEVRLRQQDFDRGGEGDT